MDDREATVHESPDPSPPDAVEPPVSRPGDRASTDSTPRRGWPRRLRPLPILPLTAAMLVLVGGTSIVLAARPEDLASIVAWASTNLENLSTHPISALFASIFVVPDSPGPELTLLAVGCGITELRLGVWRTIAIGLTGHVVATLVSEYGTAVFGALHLAAIGPSDRADVGVSYVAYSLLGAATMLLPRRLGLTVLLAALAAVVEPWSFDPGMTTIGHLVSLGCGVGIAAWLDRGSDVKDQWARKRPPRPSP